MKKNLKIVSIPLFLACIDVYFRSELLSQYNNTQFVYYISSFLISISYFVFVILFLKKIESKKALYYLVIIMVSTLMLFSIFGSYTFFSLNGIFPNYYTFLYFKTEPKSALMILRDSTTWKEILGLLITLILLVVFFRWLSKNHAPKIKTRTLIIFGILQFTAFETLIYFHGQYDQCATVDTNFAACLQRHAFTWDDHSAFKGKGLEQRILPEINLKKDKKNYNVVVFIFESFRKRSAQIYGNRHETTPTFVKIAKEQPNSFYCFQQPVSVASTTMLAVPAILTGIGPYQDKSVLYSQPLIWEYAKIFDYKTFFLSSHTLKWYRFDEFYKKEKLDVWWNKDNSGLPFFNDLGVNDKFTIQKLNKTIGKFNNEPFFGVVQLNTTHYPYEVPQKYTKWNNSFRDTYDNAISYQDALIATFFEQLKAKGLMKNTIVLFVSDHGESLMEHRNIGHVESNYTETISIPLIAYIPPGIISEKENKIMRKNSRQLTSNIDIAPTIMDLLELENEPILKPFKANYTGYSLLKSIPENRTVISLNNNQIANFNTGLSVASKHWHYLYRTNIVPNKEEFYYWKKDIGELHNRSKKLSSKQRKFIIDLISKYPVCDKLREKVRKD
ncbi:MAG: DUF229 domain-containing protein [Crocinitomicaceae bacterium]|nr:DUF229 domain-containing protein [Crocinitomicaceae bacterium]